MREIAVLMNPCAGLLDIKGKEKSLERIVKRFGDYGIRVDCFGLETKNREEFRELAKELSKSYESLIIAGGDGSFFDVLNSGINSNVKLGYLPLGTGNALQKMLKIRNLSHGIQRILNKNITPHDLISYNEKFRCFYAVTGLDAEFVSSLDELRKSKNIKVLKLHVAALLESSSQHKQSHLEIQTESQNR